MAATSTQTEEETKPDRWKQIASRTDPRTLYTVAKIVTVSLLYKHTLSKKSVKVI